MGQMNHIKEINQGDVLTFLGVDKKYKVILCTSTYKIKSPHTYHFAALTVDKLDRPTVEDIRSSEFFGVGNSGDKYFKYSEKELEKMWTIHPEIKPYFLGSYMLIIWRKDFMQFRDNFEVIGNLDIVDNLDKNGSGGLNASSWNVLRDFFTDTYRDKLEERRQNNTFKVEAIIRD
jgi:hypothetical protein